jgi:hypothetical protein
MKVSSINRSLMFLLIGSTALMLLTVQSGSAQEAAPKPASNNTVPIKKELVVENIYNFSVMEYEPKVVFQPQTKQEQASHDTPEQAVLSHFSAMYSGNYQWFQSTWSEESRKANDADDNQRNRTPEFWIGKWKSVLTGNKVELTNKIETGSYVLIAYRLVPSSGEAAILNDTLALVIENGRWVITQELASDPVLSLWNAPSLKFKKVIR